MISDPLQSLRYHVVMDSHASSVEEACKKYGLSRSWIYELRKRYREEGQEGLFPRSRAPKNPFRKVTPFMEDLVVYFKKKLAGWGATRTKNVLFSFRIDLCETTIRGIWKKHGITTDKRKKRQQYSENVKGGKKNAYWQTDLLTFKLEDGTAFSMLLSVDTHSRYITCLKAFKSATVLKVIDALEKAFVKEGRPAAIVTGNGSQFCARVDEQRHAFKEFLVSKNTCHLRIPPGNPRKNGIVERAVQNVKVEALRPFTSTTIADVQKRLYRWRNWYNFHRRHMGIENKCPAELFQPWHHRYGRSFLTDLLGKDFTVSTM